MLKSAKIGIIGLGYVGLPLAVEFGKLYPTFGYDINKDRIDELRNFSDKTNEVSNIDLKDAISEKFDDNGGLKLTEKIDDLKKCNIYIITVPTPIDSDLNPLLEPIISATKTIAKILKPLDLIIYESTVYPGLTEELCVPIIEEQSSLKLNKGFFVGYSPERINPGDKVHNLKNIVKVTSGSNPETAKLVDELYKSIITAGTYMAPSIKVAEAAKVIENTQRDINIAFVNELAKIFNLLDIDTNEVLNAAKTKWNFLDFKPGLVGGHCIGVDPYYLANKSIDEGYVPEIILSGRKINNSMGKYISDQVISLLKKQDIDHKHAKILVLGITFKENCPDIRNTKVIDLINNLKSNSIDVSVYDPWANKEEVFKVYKLTLLNDLNDFYYDAIILAVPHLDFLGLDLKKLKKKNSIIYDIKGFLGNDATKRL